jgi:hypothetical protein
MNRQSNLINEEVSAELVVFLRADLFYRKKKNTHRGIPQHMRQHARRQDRPRGQFAPRRNHLQERLCVATFQFFIAQEAVGRHGAENDGAGVPAFLESSRTTRSTSSWLLLNVSSEIDLIIRMRIIRYCM